MKIHRFKRVLMLFPVFALFLGLQLLPAGWALAVDEPPSPQIVSVEPSAEIPGTIAIIGTGFGDSAASSTVTFGETVLPASSIVSWADTQITCDMPEGMETGEIEVLVTTPGGASNKVLLKVGDIPKDASSYSIVSVTPYSAMQFSLVTFNITTSYFAGEPGMMASLSLEDDAGTAYPLGFGSAMGYNITGVVFVTAPPGVYDVVITITGMFGSIRYTDAFTVTPVCGMGSGPAVLALGVTMGFLSLAGSGGFLRRRRRKRR